MRRRSFIARTLASAAALGTFPHAASAAAGAARLVVPNVTRLYDVEVARIEAPSTAEQVAALLHEWTGRVAVGGARYSMGGQIAVTGGLHLDMRPMNRLVWLRAADKRVRVQAGMRWRDLQDVLDPHDLAVKTMQSYSNFSVGGSVSVNAHGRYVGHGPLGDTVLALQLVLADGSVVDASPTRNVDLFRAAIGGYGAVGVITEVELELADNVRIERRVLEVPLDDYVHHFEQDVLTDPDAVLHNADLMPPRFDRPVSVTWRRTDRHLTVAERLVPRGGRYGLEQNALFAMTELPGGRHLRHAVVQPLMGTAPVVQWLNHEASLDVAQLEPRTRAISTYVLQEYFVPGRHFAGFARAMAASLRRHRVEALNVSIRHAPADGLSLLPWAREPVYSFVLYYKQRVHVRAREAVGRWTRELIETALRHEGRYYLPYQLHATPDQFGRAYPEATTLRAIKREFDPRGRLSNELWARYL